jgi:hypothetical protein
MTSLSLQSVGGSAASCRLAGVRLGDGGGASFGLPVLLLPPLPRFFASVVLIAFIEAMPSASLDILRVILRAAAVSAGWL